MDSLHPTMDQFERPDPVLTNKIVTQLKSQGIFDQFRRECMADVDTKPAYQNLRQRVEGSVAAFLKKNPWRPDMNKNQLRDNLRKHIQSGGFLDIGVDRIVDQVVNPKIYTVFLPKVEEVVHNCLGMDKDKPKPELALYNNANPEPPKFQNKHNLAPRARIPAPLTGPRVPIIPNIEALKPPEPVKSANKDNDTEQSKASDSPEEPADEKYVVDEDDAEDVVEEEEDEESPPFEPVSESDQMILGVHTDSSDENSDESRIGVVMGSGGEDSDDSEMKQVIREKEESEEREKTQIEKERSDSDEKEKSENEEKEISDIEEREKPDRSGVEKTKKSEHEKETSESDEKDDVKKDLDYSSDEYIPKTPTINLESSDGTVIEFNSISEYKQYQSKYDEDSLGNVEEEVVSSQWVDESSNAAKEYRSSNEDDSGGGLQKRKLMDHFDDASSSSVDKGSTSDEGKSDTLYLQKKIKVEDERDSETTYNEDSNTEKSCDMSDHKHRGDGDHKRRHTSSSSSKDSGRSHHRHDGHVDNSRHHSSLSSSQEKGLREGSVSSSHSSRDKRDGRKESKHDNSKHRHSKKSEPVASKSHDSSRSKLSEKKEKDEEKKRIEKSEDVKKETVEVEKYKLESRHEHRDKSKSHQDKERKKHESQDKQSPGKRDHDSSYKQDKDKRDDSRSSKHSHSSSRHRSSSEKYKSEKEKHKECTADNKKPHDKKSDKDSKKRHREHCKTSDIDNEGRRSTDRDSNGPGGKSYSHSSNTSRSTSSRSRAVDKTIYTENRSSNSDNTVSDNVDAPGENLFDQGIASPDPEPMEDTWSEPHLAESEVNKPREDASEVHKLPKGEINEKAKLIEVEYSKSCKSEDSSIAQKNGCTSKTVQPKTCKLKELRIEIEKISDNHESVMNYVASNTSSESHDENEQDFPTTSVHDTSSEKENIEQVVNFSDKNNANETLQVDEKLPKFKKPKIAANIFEVRKIMQARRRLEKKRIKLLMMNNTEECAILESTPSKTDTKETPPEEKCPPEEKKCLPEEFMGFDDVTSNKIETFNILMQRLSSEVSTFVANLCDNHNLITSWIDVNPELDDYIENVLKGKVHRKMRVRLPKISNEHYKFDTNEGAYILIQNTSEDSSMIENNQLVDNNLNNLNPSLTSPESNNSAEVDKQNKLNTFNGSTSESIIQGSLVEKTDKTTSKRKLSKQSSESSVSENKREKLDSERDYSNSVSDAIEIETTGKPVFSLTFNQTYDEILKEKTQPNSLAASKMLKDEVHKNPRTVVKITNNETSEQLVVKPVKASAQVKCVRITKSETVLNGKVSNHSQGKKVPFISRINKSKNVVVTPISATKTGKVNGVVPPDSTMFEAAVIENISQTVINSVIGIQSPSKCGGAAINPESPTRDIHVQKIQRETRGSTGQRGPQHYDSSDLYKPRLQLSSRRVRSQPSPGDRTSSTVLAGRKRPMVVTSEVATPKRRR